MRVADESQAYHTGGRSEFGEGEMFSNAALRPSLSYNCTVRGSEWEVDIAKAPRAEHAYGRLAVSGAV